jgi:hypothetical protein
MGFAADGTLKLFDFGLAKVVQKSSRDMCGTYKLTGAPRPLAPPQP